ncbi:signal peptidase II [Burkholderia thailandensis]|uniref:Lipoprotein signal peptidase n=2 Tax=Burkholderia thailandensis TaxID=57975 RepID=LSPA_BURTA|nr:signal peptidase II [Burkholderia thailandensis]Q2T0H4.1 RecName: Full=Lipoprotein signal peptidase; AltName: Full=Prolipoprotein signal peptidase; AltName: Full=Signal peptidase II; Short=SPase II [Burkholderia thailandensis E264]ABC39549.1 signal peptidase II [Burkholderia thailandensis E264]AHI63185.1 signal peptidase II [Burkholderia thailandensis H0587]AHI73009.1 signal peptidase II [Burkholderia thailandensis 2002721723]AHI79613.1 signal peptidase II [Burkholderia thailandensis E444]
MAKTLSKSSGGALAPWLGISLIVILFDQLTKIAVLKTFAYGAMHQLTPFFNLTLIYNRGAAFGFLATAGGWQRWAFTALGIGATLVICYLLKRHGHQRLFSLSLALILGGALGNVIDRLIYGHVIDFLDFHVGAWHWPAFNLADSAITVGAVLLIYDELRRVRGAR